MSSQTSDNRSESSEEKHDHNEHGSPVAPSFIDTQHIKGREDNLEDHLVTIILTKIHMFFLFLLTIFSLLFELILFQW